MIPLTSLPTLNAVLNALSAVLLLTGYFFIRRGQPVFHKWCMLSAFASSTLFLTSYLIYHYYIGSRPFGGQGLVRAVYFAVLFSHVVLAATIVPLALITLRRALKENFKRHARMARRTLPLWLYVNVTGVIVYWMLYHL